MSRSFSSLKVAAMTALLSPFGTTVFAAEASAAAPRAGGAPILDLLISGGVTMIFLVIMSMMVVASVIYHFMNVRVEKLVPQDMAENVLSLLERKEYDKAAAVCRQQSNIISILTLKGLQRVSKGKAVVEEAVQYEGRSQIERLWQNLTYLGDMAVIAPMLGLLGTIIGMIDAFGFFRVGAINPASLTQGLAKAMINTAVGLVIAVPALIFYSYFRGRVGRITALSEAIASEIVTVINK